MSMGTCMLCPLPPQLWVRVAICREQSHFGLCQAHTSCGVCHVPHTDVQETPLAPTQPGGGHMWKWSTVCPIVCTCAGGQATGICTHPNLPLSPLPSHSSLLTHPPLSFSPPTPLFSHTSLSSLPSQVSTIPYLPLPSVWDTSCSSLHPLLSPLPFLSRFLLTPLPLSPPFAPSSPLSPLPPIPISSGTSFPHWLVAAEATDLQRLVPPLHCLQLGLQ